LFADHGVGAQVTGMGSLFNVHFTEANLVNYRAVRRNGNPQLSHAFHLGMLNHGILMAPRGLGAVSEPMGQTEQRAFIAAADGVLQEMFPGRTSTGPPPP
jgi:glutamate-1-semialdehyde 2,1-aminomutase